MHPLNYGLVGQSTVFFLTVAELAYKNEMLLNLNCFCPFLTQYEFYKVEFMKI